MIEKNQNKGEQPVLAFFGDEPAVDAQGILTTWATAWPRVIAKVWKLESDIHSFLEKMNDKQKNTLPQYIQSFINVKSDSAPPSLTSAVARYLIKSINKLNISPDIEKGLRWYVKLRSNRINLVAAALMELGFINNTFMNNNEEGSWFFENVKIYIKNAEDGVALLNDDTTTRNTIKYDISKDKDDRCLVEYSKTVKPYEKASFKKRYLYYNNQQRSLYLNIKKEVEDYFSSKKSNDKSCKAPHYQYEIINEFKPMIDTLIDKKSKTNIIIEKIFELKMDEEMEINGWWNVRDKSDDPNGCNIINNKGEKDSLPHGKRTEHVVVLTIPSKPADDQIGVALTDYCAAGKNYPFTCCIGC